MFYVYILYNKEIDRYYVGHTYDLIRRLVGHNKGFNRIKYTRKQKGSWKIVYFEEYLERRQAILREK